MKNPNFVNDIKKCAQKGCSNIVPDGTTFCANCSCDVPGCDNYAVTDKEGIKICDGCKSDANDFVLKLGINADREMQEYLTKVMHALRGMIFRLIDVKQTGYFMMLSRALPDGKTELRFSTNLDSAYLLQYILTAIKTKNDGD